MVREKTKRTFNTEYLKQIKDEENSCVTLQRNKLHITVHPYQLKEFTSSLKEVLSEKIARYNKQLGGILLGYDNIVLDSNDGYINDDSCFMHINIEGNFYVFKPEIGQLLKGVVNKKSKSHVGCLVYQLFNVSLPSPEEDEEWLGDNVSVGQEIVFRIVDTNLNRKLPYIQGDIVCSVSDSDSGISTSEERKLVDDGNSEEQKSKKKKKKYKEKQTEIEQEQSVIEEETTQKKQRKKKRHPDESVIASTEDVNVSKIHKNKKYMKEESFAEIYKTTVESKRRKHERIDNKEADISPKKKKRKLDNSE